MTVLTKLTPENVAKKLQEGTIALFDIREADEFARDHIDGALPLPLSALDKGAIKMEAGQSAVFHCRSGMRTETNCAKLAAHVEGEAFVLEGGLDAWKKSGLPTVTDASAPLELNRQVQIAAGLLILTGVAAGAVVNPIFYGLSAFVGAGLAFAGFSGWCGMAHLLALAPWNRRLKTG